VAANGCNGFSRISLCGAGSTGLLPASNRIPPRYTGAVRLLTGPAGSGKTPFILDCLRQALRSGNHSVRLLVPTATLAQHLQNQIAREGFVFHRNLIQTLSAFVEPWAGEPAQAPDAVVYLTVEEAARLAARPEFARVADTAGFYAALTKTINEFASAGCDSAQLAQHLPDAPLAEAFLAVYRELEGMLQDRGLSLRGRCLERAAERIAREGTGGIGTIWLDGFHALPDPELGVLAALARHADLTLTLDERDLTGAVRARLEAIGLRHETLRRARPAPAIALVRAPNMEREADEIARRILEQAAAGRPFREMAIIVRAAEIYVPLLRSTLDRFGIPAHFYFDSRLDEHAAIRFVTSAVDAMLGGWDYAATLAALRLAPRFADSSAMDRFDFAVREQMPNAGLGGLKALAQAEPLAHKLDALGETEEWRLFALTPKNWAARLRLLRNLFRPARPDPAFRDGWQMWRSQAAALDLFDEALVEAAAALDARREIPLEAFWRAVKAVLRVKPLRMEDGRRNVVHVLSAHEARQWVLPVVFVCGLVEKLFPQFHGQDLFFPDSGPGGARALLNGAGIRVRTAAEMEREERALFDSALTRATMLVTLSYPECDARGERNLRSAYLDGCLIEEQTSRPVRPRPREWRGREIAPAGIRQPRLLEVLRQRTVKVSPTSLESYLQCPFQYFGSRLLRLTPAPPRPEERLDFLTQGNIVHEVLARWYSRPHPELGGIAALFEEIFARTLEEKQIPAGYHTERLRNAMLDDLVAFTRAERFPAGEFESRMEEKFEFALNPSLTVSGKIDRLDVAADGTAYVVDYKYSNAQNTKGRRDNPNLLQAPLYLMAVEKFFGLKAAGMYYIGLKGGVEPAGWEAAELPADWLDESRARTAPAAWTSRRSTAISAASAIAPTCAASR
jgi:ATP-dependent helicase/DNAse subunit B